MSKLITSTEIIELHDFLLKAYGGLMGIKSPQGLTALDSLPYMKLYGEEAYPTVIQKIAFITFKLAHDHLFEDGNKRTAGAVLVALWELNVGEVSLGLGRLLEHLVVKAASGQRTLEEFTEELSNLQS